MTHTVGLHKFNVPKQKLRTYRIKFAGLYNPNSRNAYQSFIWVHIYTDYLSFIDIRKYEAYHSMTMLLLFIFIETNSKKNQLYRLNTHRKCVQFTLYTVYNVYSIYGHVMESRTPNNTEWQTEHSHLQKHDKFTQIRFDQMQLQ